MISIQEDVIAGLLENPKRISSKWFYDEKGDKLFQDIMELPEYYLTRAEYSVLKNNANNIFSYFSFDKPIQIVELGAGDGKKTRVLFNYLNAENKPFEYVPIDISQNALSQLEDALKQEYPRMDIKSIQTDYFEALKSEALQSTKNKLVLFLGSNVGNLNEKDSIDFFSQLHSALKPGDGVLIGFDRAKNPETILAAYNDAAGVTRNFNLNLLTRLNRELGANFELKNWEHQPKYDIERKSALSFIRSTKEQSVTFEKANKTIHFDEGELIHTEISRKFDLEDILNLAAKSGFKVAANFDHEEPLYTDILWLV
jgi:L-histidine Nalpha-methyltransferase